MQDPSEKPGPILINGKSFQSSRLRDAQPDIYDPNRPRLGRRESEPHSWEISYIHDVLSTNFPNDRTMWDLHHYFKKNDLDIDIQFDISYFKDLDVPYTLSSYHAEEFENKVPTMAINVLSKSTWRSDLAEKVDYCQMLKIPIYIVFPSYHVSVELYKPPFLRAYLLQDNGKYKTIDIRKVIKQKEDDHNFDYTIDLTKFVPFKIGLVKLKKKHQKDQGLYRLVFIDSNTQEILLTSDEKKSQLIEEQAIKIEKLESEVKKLKQKLQNK